MSQFGDGGIKLSKGSYKPSEHIPFFNRLIVHFLMVALLTSTAAFSTSQLISTKLPELLFDSQHFQAYWDQCIDTAFVNMQKNVTDNQYTRDEVIESMPQRLASENIVFYFEMVPFLDLDDPIHQKYIEDHDALILYCADGNLVSTSYMLGEPLVHIYQISGMVGGTVVACIILSIYVLHLLHRIKHLYQQILYSRNVDVHKRISLKGSDELAALSQNIEQMRTCLLELIDREKELRDNHMQLIATLSHDIRTPLTKLMGYTEILHYKKYADPSEQSHCISYMLETIKRLREMTDNLLDCVLVKGQLMHDDCQLVDGPEFLTQVLYEGFSDLEKYGFKVFLPDLKGSYALNICISDFLRIIDNLSSNIMKYACREHPVLISAEDTNETVKLNISNHKAAKKKIIPHHGIGLASVNELIKKMGGSFKALEEKEEFSVCICIPKVNLECHAVKSANISSEDI